MAEIIDMQLMRYINLFSKITRVPTTKCFVYNNQIVFVVPKVQVSMAIGRNAVNIKKLNSILRRKIRVVAMPAIDVSLGNDNKSHNLSDHNLQAGENFSQNKSSQSDNNEEIRKFIEAVVSPVEFNKIEVKENSVVISAGRQSKAALIGRGRQRERELSEVLKNFFKITKLRIV